MSKISLCMIARNEERMLPECLDSVKGLVHEIVLVDTGSTDATRDVAERRGARVYARAWDDDFAAPRNLAIQHATGDWVLILDADERLVPGCSPAIRRAVKRRDIDLGMLRLHNAARSDATAPEVLSGARRIGEVNHVPRLLRRTPDLEYRGVVHEDVSDWIAARGMGIDLVDADIVHLGAVPSHRDALNKRARNVALLEKRSRLEPDSVVPLGYLAMEHWEAGNVEEALRVAERGWEMIDAQPAHRSAYMVGAVRAFCLARRGDEAGLRETVKRMVDREGARRDFSFLAGVAEELRSRGLVGEDRKACLEEALHIYRDIRTAAHGFEQRSFIGGSTTWSARIRAGTVLLQLGRSGEALEEFAAALREVPDEEEAILGAAEASLDRGNAAGALERILPVLDRGTPRPDGWVLAAAASVQTTGSFEGASALIARARSLEPNGYLAPYRAARLHAMCSRPQEDRSASLLAALMEGRPVPAEVVGQQVGDAMLRAVAQKFLRSGRAGLLERLLGPAAASASPGLPERMRGILQEL